MSWQTYVDSNLVGTGSIAQAAIYGVQGGVWAASSGFALQGNEFQDLAQAFQDPSGIRANGLYLGGTKYFTLRADPRSIYGKQGAGGVVCVKTGQAILIGTYGDGTAPGEATKVVEALADYLISVGY
ncbi:Profilin/allergen [Basidiobolus meristosporus CBS 931.73]|uniref:Profilin n=1 Tax=Basidiobolus meristosporus CBS 931.73 TaxID=1314790 RepID=A0A1Y1YMP1_9FUNG|nr:Profilin/allergen [Basidiobolus meristosporus CBS 931.73]|eukprot:ORX99006.1 Profilin/allergen [Basidiobolus meristosporus CBS 931.73]